MAPCGVKAAVRMRACCGHGGRKYLLPFFISGGYYWPSGILETRMARTIGKAPGSIVENRRLNAGHFDEPVRNVNLADLSACPFRRAFRYMRMKEWCGIGFVHPRWYLSVMIQDAKYLSSGFVYLWDRENRRFFQHGWNAPGRTVTVAANQWQGYSLAKRPGFLMKFDHDLGNGQHAIHIDVAKTARAPAIKADLILHEDLSQVAPLVACLPIDDFHQAYTHKAPMGISGVMEVDGHRFDWVAKRDTANMDEHKAVYPYHTKWYWGSFAGRDASGRYFGVNLADHMFRDQENSSENCVWLGNRIELPGRIRYDVDVNDPFRPWKITDDKGLIDLEFRPEGRFVQRANLIVAGIDYFQMFGAWHGKVVAADGQPRPVDGMFGVAEKMDTRF